MARYWTGEILGPVHFHRGVIETPLLLRPKPAILRKIMIEIEVVHR